jgi:ATP-dependent RNA helicase DDX41
MAATAASSAATDAAAVSGDEDNYEEYIPVAKRRAMEAERLRQLRLSKQAPSSAAAPSSSLPLPPPLPQPPAQASVPDAAAAKLSLLVTSTQLKRAAPEVTPTEERIMQEKEMIENLSEKKTLMSVYELAKGIIYTEPLKTGWKPPLRLRRMPLAKANDLRRKWHIIVEGDDIPPPVRDFRDLRLPDPILGKLRERGIVQPTPIQVQGLPVVLSGRDMIGIAFTGSGKTLVFVLPLIMVALQEESLMPIVPGEGPFGMIICPSRELAKQTYDVIEQFLAPLKAAGYPEIRPLLCIGGVDMRAQLDVVKKGVHIVVATPGRLKDFLAKKKMNLDNCR